MADDLFGAKPVPPWLSPVPRVKSSQKLPRALVLRAAQRMQTWTEQEIAQVQKIRAQQQRDHLVWAREQLETYWKPKLTETQYQQAVARLEARQQALETS